MNPAPIENDNVNGKLNRGGVRTSNPQILVRDLDSHPELAEGQNDDLCNPRRIRSLNRPSQLKLGCSKSNNFD